MSDTTPELTKNVELARKVREHTRRHPETFDMGDWFRIGFEDSAGSDHRTVDDIPTGSPCGTAACFAGWTVLLGGYGMDEDGWVYQGAEKLRRGGLVVHADGMAQELLGITEEESSRLFFSSEDELDDRLAEVFGERI